MHLFQDLYKSLFSAWIPQLNQWLTYLIQVDEIKPIKVNYYLKECMKFVAPLPNVSTFCNTQILSNPDGNNNVM